MRTVWIVDTGIDTPRLVTGVWISPSDLGLSAARRQWLCNLALQCLLRFRPVKRRKCALYLRFKHGTSGGRSRRNSCAQLVSFLLPLLTSMKVGRVMARAHDGVPHVEFIASWGPLLFQSAHSSTEELVISFAATRQGTCRQMGHRQGR